MAVFAGCDPFSDAGLKDNGDGTFGPTPAYQSTYSFGDVELQIELNHAHPFLAEYQKIVTVSKHNVVIGTEEFMDTGGLSSLYVFRDGESLTIIDGIGNGVQIDTENSTCKRINENQLVKEIDESSIGRFMFVAEPSREYKYISAEQLPERTKQ
jgi:hypothetical protein